MMTILTRTQAIELLLSKLSLREKMAGINRQIISITHSHSGLNFFIV